MTVKGEVYSREELYIDGDVQGSIELHHRLTIGPNGKVRATVRATEVVVHGTIQGRKVTNPEELKKLFQFAYERYVSDTFWLMMPLMMLDPPFQRAYDGPRNDSCGNGFLAPIALRFAHKLHNLG